MNFLAFLWGPGSWTRVCSFWVQVRTSKPCSDLLANTVSLQSAWQSSAPADVKQTKRSREHSNKHFQVVEFLICFWHYQSSTYLRQIKDEECFFNWISDLLLTCYKVQRNQGDIIPCRVCLQLNLHLELSQQLRTEWNLSQQLRTEWNLCHCSLLLAGFKLGLGKSMEIYSKCHLERMLCCSGPCMSPI